MKVNVKQVVLNPELEDEEPLIPTAREVRSAQALRFTIATTERPPSCGFCFNTRCGAYFVAALQIAYGLLHLMGCLAFINVSGDKLADDLEKIENGEGKQLSDREFIFDIKLIWSVVVATFAVGSGVLAFHGLSFNKARMMRPSIILYFVGVSTFLMQLVCILIYWDDISATLRTYLKSYCTDVETTLADEIKSETAFNMDTSVAVEDLQVWKQIEYMITDDNTWSDYTKGYLMTVMSAICMVNVTIFSWFAWILMAQMGWMVRKGHY